MNNLILEKKANEFRNCHVLGSNDSIRLKSPLSKLNVLTVFKPLNSNFSGMAIKVNNYQEENSKKFILINSTKSLGSQHFTICHELYHLFIQKNFRSMVCTAGLFRKNDGEEYNADLFAAYLLMPELAVKSLIPDNELGKNKITIKTILKVEQYFSCSRMAILVRLKELDIIDSKNLEHFKTNVKRSALEHGYLTDLYEPGNHNQVVGDYGTVARELFENGKISESHYYTLLLDLGMNIEELEKLENGED
jgi:Zn-dependent peptidase ImmA (M78 family)